jgi:hypothetical protein
MYICACTSASQLVKKALYILHYAHMTTTNCRISSKNYCQEDWFRTNEYREIVIYFWPALILIHRLRRTIKCMWLALYTHNITAFSFLFIIFSRQGWCEHFLYLSGCRLSSYLSLSPPLYISPSFRVKSSRRRIVSERQASIAERREH